MDEEKLILLVSNYPELYDLQNENYMNTTRKNNIWQEIAKEVGIEDTVCKDKWKSLRDGFHRNVKKRKTKSGDPAKKNKKWKFEKQMQFLLPYLQERTTKTNFEDTASVTSDDTIPEHVSVTSPLSSTSTASINKTITARKKNLIQKQSPSVAQVLNNYLDRSTARLESRTENPINSFFKAMADTVITLPPDLQIKAKNKVFAIVSEIEYENFQRMTMSSKDQALVVTNSSNVSCEFEKQLLNPNPSTSTQGPPHNQAQKLQINSENIDLDSDTCISLLGEVNDVSQSVLQHNGKEFILTSDGVPRSVLQHNAKEYIFTSDGVPQSVVQHNANEFILTSDGRIIRRQ